MNEIFHVFPTLPTSKGNKLSSFLSQPLSKQCCASAKAACRTQQTIQHWTRGLGRGLGCYCFRKYYNPLDNSVSTVVGLRRRNRVSGKNRMAGLIAGSFSKKQIEENRERKRRISLFFFHLLTKRQLKTSPLQWKINFTKIFNKLDLLCFTLHRFCWKQ